MRLITLFLFSLLILAGWTRAYAQADDPPKPEPVILTDEQDEYPLGLHLEILEDPGGELTIEDVSAPEFDSRFVASEVEAPNYGFTESSYWVRLHLRNEARLTERWLLDVDFANMHFVDLYTPLADSDGFEVKQTGSLRSPETRDITHPRTVFNMPIPSQSEQTIYLRFQNGGPMILPLTLWQPNVFADEALKEQVVAGVFFGVVLGLLFYHLFLFISLREVLYLYLVLLLIGVAAYEASQANYLEIYLVPSSYQYKYHIIAMSTALLMISTVLLHDSFLTAKKLFPNIYRMDVVLVAIWGVLVLATFLTSYHNLATVMAPMIVVTFVASSLALLSAWPRGFRANRALIIALLGLFASILSFILGRLGVISNVTITENLFRLGYVSLAVCWSLALADRINRLKSETEEANLELRSSERRLAQILDGLPLGVTVYGQDQKPTYANRRVKEILANPDRGIKPDLSAGRTLAQTMRYFSFRVTGSDQDYPLEDIPVFRALQGERASVDDIEADLVDRRVPLEIWASPVKDDAGRVQSAVVAFQDITQRKQAEAELAEYRKSLEHLVEERTEELSAANKRLSQEIVERETLELLLYQHIEWLTALNQVRQSIGGTADLPQVYDKLFATILHLLDAGLAFLLRWDGQGDQVEAYCYPQRTNSIQELNGISSFVKDNSPLRQDIERGKIIVLPADQAASFPGPIGECFQVDGFQSLILAPLIPRQSVAGVLGVAMPQPMQEFIPARAEFVKTMTRDLAELADDAQLLDQARALVAVEERNRLARDLHDSVTQVLFSASLVAEVLPQIWRRDPEKALQSLEELRRLTRGALAEMRTMLLELRPSSVIKTPLPELLAQLTEAITSRRELPFKLFIEQIPPLPEDVHTSFYRIAQEALNNVVKHAQASQVTVSLSATPMTQDPAWSARHEVKMVIEDDGVGFSPGLRWQEHLGMSIMRERAAAIQATLSVESQPGGGTQVILIWCSVSENLS
jgi:signal transduction histidine kinase/PAS domain-containing protein